MPGPLNRTLANCGWAIGGLLAAAALTTGGTTVYTWLLAGDALSFLCAAALTARCGEPPSAARTVATSAGPATAPRPTSPWRDRTYLAYTATEAVLFLDDAVFKVGLPLWIAHATHAPSGLAPLLMVLSNVLVIALQVPLARFGATSRAARTLLLPVAACFTIGGIALTVSAATDIAVAVTALTAAAIAFTLAEILHATASWELSLALAPERSQGAYLGVHGLAQSAQRSAGPLAVTAAIAAGPLGWTVFGAGIALTCVIQHRLVRDHLPKPSLSVATATVSDH
ncbi:hypothetical protein [Streptomyces sp. NPDC058045]|uniref:hypothetical protein n=1 Tax=Streptomyces sp. NPDC058045 TaxID=3346311 RepID=UPI0036EC0064